MQLGVVHMGNIAFGVVVEWYDLWVGMYYDAKRQKLYIMVPFIGIYIQYIK
jgi:hypothetical protein